MRSTSVFSTTSETDLQLAFTAGAVALMVAFAIAARVMWMRVRDARRMRELAQVHERWRPLLARAALDGADELSLPPLRKRGELSDVLLLWNQLQEGLRGSAHHNLNRLAQRLGLRDMALRWSQKGDKTDRILGLATLGHLGRAEDAAQVRAALTDRHALVSLAAARALLQIDAKAAVPLVLDEYLSRDNWSAPRVGTLLRDAGADAVGPPLIERLLAASNDDQLVLLRLLRFAESPRVDSVLHQLLEHSRDPLVLSVALRQLHGPGSLPRVRALASHKDALVRSAAAVALGRIGTGADRGLLASLMADGDWWVRYRAAQAQLALPGTDATVVIALRRQLADRYARDILHHVLAEHALAQGFQAGSSATQGDPRTASPQVVPVPQGVRS
ncbi:MAG TPA: HEAT repeat domain-containing protein [Methylibium sp.]